MTNSKLANLMLHFKFDEVSEGAFVDASGNGHPATIEGDPAHKSDIRFGNVAQFDGTADSLLIANHEDLQITGDQTIAFWLKPANLNNRQNPYAKAYGGEGTITVEPNGTISYYYGTAGSNAQPYQGFKTSSPIPAQEWSHVAIVRHLAAGRLAWYINGEKDKEVAASYPAATASAAAITIGRGYVSRLAGEMAHFRLYSRALTPVEIQQIMHVDQTALAAFRRAHPLRFCLCNQDEENVLYLLGDDQKGSYHFEITNESHQQVEFRRSPADEAATPAAKAFFALQFRPGTLVEADLDKVAVTPSGWNVSHERQNDGAITLYFQQDQILQLDPGETQKLTLQQLPVSASGGSRGTRVEFQYQHLYYAGETTPLSGSRIQHLSIINERGMKTIPLHAGFRGQTAVLNNGSDPNDLLLRLTNTLTPDPAYPDRTHIQFNPSTHRAASKFVLSFEVQKDNEVKEWALTTAVAAKNIQVWHSGQQITAAGTEGESPEWIISPAVSHLAGGQHMDINIKNIVTGLQSGMAKLFLRYENIPGYRDGELEILIEKSPLLFLNHRVGIGKTGSVDAQLQIINENQNANGNTLILGPTTQSNLRLGYNKEYSWIQSHGRKPLAINPLGNNVGIGTTSPSTALHIKGTTKFEGAINADENIWLQSSSKIMLQYPWQNQNRTLLSFEPNYQNDANRSSVHFYAPNNYYSNVPALTLAGNYGPGGSVGIGTTTPSQKLTVSDGHVQIDSNRVMGHNPNDKFTYDGKEMGHYSIGWFGDSWFSWGSTTWISGYGGFKFFTNGSPKLTIDYHGNVRYAASMQKFSTRAIKDNVADLPTREALATLAGLNPVKYTLKADEQKQAHLGFIAEEVPDTISSPDGKAITPDNIIAVLTRVVKDQQQMIQALEEKVNALVENNR